MRRAVLTGLCGALTALAPLVLATADPTATSPSKLLANPDRFDGQALTLQGTVEKFREGVSPDGAPYYNGLQPVTTRMRTTKTGRTYTSSRETG